MSKSFGGGPMLAPLMGDTLDAIGRAKDAIRLRNRDAERARKANSSYRD
jgi:hypothetical protein